MFVTAAAIVALAPQPSSACSCLPREEPLFELARTDAVFLGVVREIREDPSGLQDRHVYFDVLSSWKGVRRDTIMVSTSSHSTMCGYEFARDMAYLVYAYGKGEVLGTSKCSRTQPVDLAATDLAALGVPFYKGTPAQGPVRPYGEPAGYCPLHPTLPLESTGWDEVDTSTVAPPVGYLDARENSFRFSNRWKLQSGRRDLPTDNRILYCPMCRYNEMLWCQAHGGCFGWRPADPLRLH